MAESYGYWWHSYKHLKLGLASARPFGRFDLIIDSGELVTWRFHWPRNLRFGTGFGCGVCLSGLQQNEEAMIITTVEWMKKGYGISFAISLRAWARACKSVGDANVWLSGDIPGHPWIYNGFGQLPMGCPWQGRGLSCLWAWKLIWWCYVDEVFLSNFSIQLRS